MCFHKIKKRVLKILGNTQRVVLFNIKFRRYLNCFVLTILCIVNLQHYNQSFKMIRAHKFILLLNKIYCRNIGCICEEKKNAAHVNSQLCINYKLKQQANNIIGFKRLRK